jgi:hypothetical protein
VIPVELISHQAAKPPKKNEDGRWKMEDGSYDPHLQFVSIGDPRFSILDPPAFFVSSCLRGGVVTSG